MNIQQSRCEFFQGGYGRRLMIDENTIALVRGDLTANDDLRPFRVQTEAIENVTQIDFEHGFDYRSRFPAADHFRGRLGADQQPERVNEDGFAGAGFAGEEIEALIEVKFELVDEREIAHSQEAQHTWAL